MNSKINSLSNSIDSNPNIERKDGFELFPLDIQESNQSSTDSTAQNTLTQHSDDFILFPLDINKNKKTTNKTFKIIPKLNKPKRQFITKPQSVKKTPFTQIPQIRLVIKN